MLAYTSMNICLRLVIEGHMIVPLFAPFLQISYMGIYTSYTRVKKMGSHTETD